MSVCLERALSRPLGWNHYWSGIEAPWLPRQFFRAQGRLVRHWSQYLPQRCREGLDREADAFSVACLGSDVFHPAAIVVMAVDNLPCELPKDASEGFGEMFMEHVIPAFFNGDKDGILQRAKMTENGKLTPRFSYLQDYVDGK